MRSIPSASDTVVPDSVVTRPMGKRMTPATRPPSATVNAAVRQKHARRARFHEQQTGAPGRPDQQVPQGPQAGLPRDGVPGDHRDGERQEERDGHGEPGQGGEHAVSGHLVEKGRPVARIGAT